MDLIQMIKDAEQLHSGTDDSNLEQNYLRLARDKELWEADRGQFLEAITKSVSQMLDVNRVSVYELNNEKDNLLQISLYETASDTHSHGLEIRQADFPVYHQALKDYSVIDAVDAHTDPRTSEFSATYLTPLNIGAMLDAGFHRAGEMNGVICAEYIGGARVWSESEKRFLVLIAELVSQKMLYEDLQSRNLRVSDLNNALKKSYNRIIKQNNNLSLSSLLANSLHAVRSVDEVYLNTVKILNQLPHSPKIEIFTYSTSSNLLQCISMPEAEHNANASEGPAYEIYYQALKDNEIAYCNNISEDERFSEAEKDLAKQQACQSILMIPIVYKDQRMGLISIGFSQVNKVDYLLQELAEAIIVTVSLAVANAKHESDLEYLAHHDSLTQLGNRNYFHRYFKACLDKEEFSHAVLFLLDLDRFKEVNDTLGHFTGDKILQMIGPRLQEVVHNYQSIICRLGGDEFILLVLDVESDREAKFLANSMALSIRKPYAIDNMQLEVDSSIGIAMYPQDGSNSNELLRSADVAMYQAKNSAVSFSMYNEDEDIYTPQRLAMLASFSKAIKEKELFLHYQPKINLFDGTIVGFEALVRWKHPEMGVLYPDAFIPLIEMSNAVHALTEEVLRQALEQQSIWQQQGNNYTVAVNLSAGNLNDDRIVHLITELMLEFNTPYQSLELEITETALMRDSIKSQKYLRQLAELGVQLSIDDFGTGYSSLSYLRDFPIEKLKLDRKFVMDMLTNKQGSVIVEGIIQMSKQLNLVVVAEGVEDAATIERLKQMNCQQAQGYYICKPKPWPEISEWLQSQ